MREQSSTEPTSSANKRSSRLHSVLREPTLHFLLLALVIFLAFEITSPAEENNLEVSRVEIEARILIQELTSGREATEQQRQEIEKAYIEEQILVLEARQLGLQNDARIEDMLAQKMRHVLSGDVIQPDDQELADFYQRYASRYQADPSVTVAELILDKPDQDNAVAVDSATAELIALLTDNGSLEAVQDITSTALDLLPALRQTDVSILFDEDFGNRIFAADVGQWLGPFISNRGHHWLLVRAKTTTQLPDLADIRDRVRLDWIAQEEENQVQQEIARIRQSYSITIIEPGESH